MPRAPSSDPRESVTVRLPRSTWARVDKAMADSSQASRAAWLAALVELGLAIASGEVRPPRAKLVAVPSSDGCSHPREKRRPLGYMTLCACGEVVR